MILRWPYPYRFAFGLTDDTDGATFEKTRVFYEACLQRRILPTRTVWCFPPAHPSGSHLRRWDLDATLADEGYREYIIGLHARGVELALHGATAGNNSREQQARGLAMLEDLTGCSPRVYVCHGRNRENPYWGAELVPGNLRWVARALITAERFEGHDPASPYYWSDLCFKRVQYVRKFRTMSVNVLRHNPSMPYHSASQPDVRYWFSATAQDRRAFRAITPRSLEKIAREDGAVILYIHSVHSVTEEGELDEVTTRALDDIAARDDCWRSPVSLILDRCLAMKNLIVTRRRNGLVLSNPTTLELRDVQIRVKQRTLYCSDGTVLSTRGDVVVLPLLRPQTSVCLYFDARSAEVGDSVGIGVLKSIG